MNTAQHKSACETCPVHNAGNLIKLGVNMESWDYVVALAGNPNTGKSTVFNSLTGLRQHTGNWPGKTVTRAEGGFIYADKRYKIVDLPGTYSLLSTSTDEEVARNFILFGQPDVTVIVADATRLERNLNLVLQVLEITNRVVVCLNLIDEARRHRLEINDRLLAKELGVPVVPTAARQGQGIQELLKNISAVATGEFVCKPHRIKSESKALKNALSKLTNMIESRFPGLTNARWVALRLLEGDQRIIEAIKTGELGNLLPAAQSEAGTAKLELPENGKFGKHVDSEHAAKQLHVLQ
jgi:ferrous iron transport protein B